ncbi:MAG: MFS transporter, partial [Candidatus Bathyarchaeia archaeon]
MDVGRRIDVITWMSFAFFVGWQAVSPIFPLYALELGASLVEVGWIMGSLSLTTLLTKVPFGVAARKRRVWPFISSAYVVHILSFILLYLAKSPRVLAPILIMYGLSSASFGPIIASTALNLAPPGKIGMVSGRYYFSIGMAMVIGPALGSVLLRVFEFKTLIITLIIFPALGLLTLAALAASGELKATETRWRNLDGSKLDSALHLFEILKRREVSTLCLATVMFFVADGVFQVIFPVYGARELLLPPFIIAVLFTLLGGLNALVRIPIGSISDRIGRKKPVMIGFALSALAFTTLALARGFIYLALGMLIYGVAWGIRVPPSSALLTDTQPPEDLSVAIAALWASADIGGAIGRAIAGSMAVLIPFSTLMLSLTSMFSAALILLAAGLRGYR